MVAALVLPHTLTKQIIQRAGGNPFFIEEVVRSLFEQEAIIRKEGRFEVTEKVSEIPIPNTINDVLMARIDRLEEKTRHLLKVASIIGRNFFYRILCDVASEVENIDGKLSFLSEIQLLQPQERMGEVEYLFKHALAQEAAYESLLPAKRRELHLKVAHSIEKIYKERLSEFYGMLAYHYSRAEDREKAEEYLIKAGEEALRSAASDEALHYYEEALQLYLKKSGPDADPEKIAMLEKNIALALYNRGRYEEAVNYFERALNLSWGKLPKHPIAVVLKSLSGFSHLLISLCLPSMKFSRMPTATDEEAIDLFFKKLKALAVVNPRRFFVESFYFYKKLTRFDLAGVTSGIGMFVGASTFFSFTGISFTLSRRILNLVKHRVNKDDIRQFTIFDFSKTLHNFLQGNWKAIKLYDDDLVEKNLTMGEIYWASMHLFWHGVPNIYQGCFELVESIIKRLKEIFEVYENDLSIMLKQLLNTNLLMECRKLHDASIEIEEAIKFAEKTNNGLFLIHLFSCKARTQLLMGDIEEAEKSLVHAHKITREVHAVPWQLSNFRKTKLEYDLYRFEESIRHGEREKMSEYRKKALKSCKMLLRQSQKVAQHRTESFRLTGVYYWLTKSQSIALKWWNKSIGEGESLGARPELSRTFLEVGKRLIEPESKYKKLNGIKAEEYLERAKVLFEELDMQWDLGEWTRVTKG